MDDKHHRIGFNYALEGLKSVFKLEFNFRVQCLIALVVIGTGIIMKLTSVEWLTIILVIGFVLIAEMFNTVIENLLDFLSPQIHPTVKMIKDVSAGAVLISAVIAVIIGLIIFVPKFLHIFS